MIKVTSIRKHGECDTVYINPEYIIRVSAAMNASRDTVIEVEGSQYATWCSESVDEVMSLIDKERNKDVIVHAVDDTPYAGKISKP